MKKLSRAFIALILALTMAALLPAQVFADTPDYISEVKIGMGKSESEAKAALKGYTVLDTNLNQGAGGGVGSKGEMAVYLGYKTTTERKEAITDLALMNMKGGYSPEDYETLMTKQLNTQIKPFVENFFVAIKEYRENLESKNKRNRQRAEYFRNALNKLTDDDCGGKGLGDLLAKDTKYDIGDEAYNNLSEEDKKNYADLVTIIAQSNGKATLLLESFLVKASDTEDNTWMDRFKDTTYDDLLNATGLPPTDAIKAVARKYDDDATEILTMWDAFREQLLKADEEKKEVEKFDVSDMEENAETFENFDFPEADETDMEEFAEASVEAELGTAELANKLTDVIAKDYLATVPYGDGTMLDFFTQPREEIEDDITVLYPLVASLGAGQRAGLEYITLADLVTVAGTEPGKYAETAIDELKPMSIYDGVDRSIYEKGGVALTTDALRKDAAKLAIQPESSSFPLSWWTMLSAATALGSAIAFGVTLGYKASLGTIIRNLENSIASARSMIQSYQMMLSDFAKNGYKWIVVEKCMTARQYDTAYRLLEFKTQEIVRNQYLTEINTASRELERVSARSATCTKLEIGFGVAAIVITAITLYLTYRDLCERYKTEFSPIPRHMIDEQDLIAYNQKGDQVILKNQAAYYTAAECNRDKSFDKFKEIGIYADLNGDVGQQWLALYAAKNNELVEPILASSLKAVVDSTEVPPGYKKGIHMFGSDSAFNLNSSNYVFNAGAKSVFVYFKNQEKKDNKTTLSNFTTGTVAITACIGAICGAALTVLVAKTKKKKEDPIA